MRLPIYLDGQLQKRLERIAQKRGRDLGDVVSDLLTNDVELLEEFKGKPLPTPNPDAAADADLVELAPLIVHVGALRV